jgi:hypothetical protein
MTRRARIIAGALLFAILLASRLCHLGVVWTEEAYPAAAAIQMLNGQTLYRDVWYDKPPLSAVVYLLWGAHNGWPLRIAGSIFLWLACLLAWRVAEEMWEARAGVVAASLLAFFMIFDIPASALVLGPDLLMLLPHLAAVWLAWRGNPFASGLAAGVAMLFNTKAVFVLAACLVFCPQGWLPILAGFAAPNAAAVAIMAAQGALGGYWQQVWVWGFQYARDTPLEHPIATGIGRTLNWTGFHIALAIGTAVYFAKERTPQRLRFALWMVLSLAAVAGGWRFSPRYYFQLLPVAVLLGARGYTLMTRWRAVILLALLIPFVRFGPRYVTLANDLVHERQPQWSDLTMSLDSQDAANAILRRARPGDTLLVWGYRPEVFAITRMKAGSRFLDSQPLTGVIADRHLTRSDASVPELARTNRRELTTDSPSFVVDGLGLYNRALAITQYPDLSAWLAGYTEVARTHGSIVYERKR